MGLQNIICKIYWQC